MITSQSDRLEGALVGAGVVETVADVDWMPELGDVGPRWLGKAAASHRARERRSRERQDRDWGGPGPFVRGMAAAERALLDVAVGRPSVSDARLDDATRAAEGEEVPRRVVGGRSVGSVRDAACARARLHRSVGDELQRGVRVRHVVREHHPPAVRGGAVLLCAVCMRRVCGVCAAEEGGWAGRARGRALDSRRQAAA